MPREDLVIYELHVGTFTPEGTFEAIVPAAARACATWASRPSSSCRWPSSPASAIGATTACIPTPCRTATAGRAALQRLVDAAHRDRAWRAPRRGLQPPRPRGQLPRQVRALLHRSLSHALGQGGQLRRPGQRCRCGSSSSTTPACGSAISTSTACGWTRSTPSTISPTAHPGRHPGGRASRKRPGQDRIVHVIAESDQNDVRLVTPADRGGYGLDGVWSDDFHHSVHALLTGERDGYYQDFGRPEQLAKAFNDVFVYDGCYSRFRRRRHGSRVGDLDRSRFVVCIQNHDQVGNRARGDRLGALLPRGAGRLACGLLLAFALHAAVVHGRRIRRDAALPLLLFVRRPGADRGRAAGPPGGVRRIGFRLGRRDPRPAIPRDLRLGQAELAVARGLAAGRTPATLPGSARSAPSTGPPLRDRRHTVAPARLADHGRRSSRRAHRSTRGDQRESCCLANLRPSQRAVGRARRRHAKARFSARKTNVTAAAARIAGRSSGSIRTNWS